MNGGSRLALGSLVGALVVMSLTACGNKGDLTIDNSSSSELRVLTGDDEFAVASYGGVKIIHYGCTPGDVTVKFPSGQEVLVHGPVCPDQRILVGEGTANLAPA